MLEDIDSSEAFSLYISFNSSSSQIPFLKLTVSSSNSFLNLGVEKGDRVVLFIKKSLVFVIAHIALQKIGAIAVPLNSGLKKSEMEYLLQDAEAKLILSEADTIKLIKEYPLKEN